MMSLTICAVDFQGSKRTIRRENALSSELLKRALTLVVASLVANPLFVQAEKYVDFQFDEPGMQLNLLKNAGTLSDLKWDHGAFATHEGALNIGATKYYKSNPSKENIYRTLTLPTPLTSGEVILEYTVSNWDLGGTDSAGAPGNGLSVRVLSSTNAGSNEGVALNFDVAQAPGTDIRVQTQVLAMGKSNPISGSGPASGSVVNSTALVPGTRYVITGAGNANWTDLGASAASVGTVFTASGGSTPGTTGQATKCVEASAMKANTTYKITSLGDTTWAAMGAPSTPEPAVGTIFTATAPGKGTGNGVELNQYPQDQLGDLSLINPAPTPVTAQLRANLSTGIWSTQVKVGGGSWAPLVTDGKGLTSIARIQFAVIAAPSGWEFNSTEGETGEYIRLDSLTLGTTEQASP